MFNHETANRKNEATAFHGAQAWSPFEGDILSTLRRGFLIDWRNPWRAGNSNTSLHLHGKCFAHWTISLACRPLIEQTLKAGSVLAAELGAATMAVNETNWVLFSKGSQPGRQTPSKYNCPICCLTIFRMKCFKDRYKMPGSCVRLNNLCCVRPWRGA